MFGCRLGLATLLVLSCALAACDDLALFDDLDGALDAVSDVDAGADSGDVLVDPSASADSDIAPDVPDSDADAVTVPENALVPRFEAAGGFFRSPWPSDHRLHPDGTPDLADFPHGDTGIMVVFRAAIEGVIDGFSTMPVVYVPFTTPIDDVPLPDPAVTLRPGAIAQLIDVSEEGCGRRVPVILQHDAEGDDYRPPGVLSASPVPGFVLDPATTYAFVVRREFGFEIGRPLVPPAAFEEALVGESDHPAAASLEPLRRCLADDALSLDAVGVAAVFTTQDPVSELQRFRDAVVDPERTPAPALSELVVDPDQSPEGLWTTYMGTYETPIYQEGASPYGVGGALTADESGEPAIQRWETVPMLVTYPAHIEGPHPVVVWLDGTGASLRSHLRRNPTRDLLEAGIAVATFAPQFHDTRAVPGSDPVAHGFNYTNPISGRAVFRQQALDTSYFVRVLREAVALRDGLPELDVSRLLYGGHSQGALVGTLIAGVETEFVAYVINGAGSYTSVTIEERVDPIDIQALVRELFALRRDIDTHHPIVQIAQLGADVVDPHNYAPRWSGHAANLGGTHLFMVNGMNDPTTFPRSMNALTISGDLAPVFPAGWDVDPWGVWDRDEEPPPISGNRESPDGTPLTLASYLSATTGHYTLRNVDEVSAAAVGFWQTALEGTPRLDIR